jgi:hypothetical protein
MKPWIIKIIAPGHPDRFATALGVSENQSEANVYDHRDNKAMKLAFFSAVIAKAIPGVRCEAVPL